MEVYETEEEQVQALKKWWRENGTAAVMGVVIAVVAIFGWRTYQTHLQKMNDQAAVVYQDIVDVFKKSGTAPLDEPAQKTVDHLIQQMDVNYSKTSYATLAKVFEAKAKFESKDIGATIAALELAYESATEREYKKVIAYKIAQAHFAKQDYPAALKALQQKNRGVFDPLYAELEGDIYRVRGDKEKARAAYEQAKASTLREEIVESPLLAMKLNALNFESLTPVEPKKIEKNILNKSEDENTANADENAQADDA